MAEAQLQQFLDKVRQLNAFVALTEAQPELRTALRDCSNHHEVVSLAARFGFDIGRRWGDPSPAATTATANATTSANANASADANEPAAAAPPADQRNLLSGPCPPPGDERSTVLLEGGSWRLERIHSCGASSPAGFWYDQAETEWVLLLRGSARLQFADEPEPRDLCVGDSLLIAPHRRHRLVATDPDPGTLWLALFWTDGGADGSGAPASRPTPG